MQVVRVLQEVQRAAEQGSQHQPAGSQESILDI